MKFFDVNTLAEMLGTSPNTILILIRDKQIAATNIARSPSAKKGRWRVTQAALDEFLARRSSTLTAEPRTTTPRRTRRKPQPAGDVQYY